ncbi:hypothetical protein FOA52_010737 [Chlamydomonas sp. UWO 241]|nr:hypothetical protein FOA52_010737 [Chlamydomonas sp. UWO 241]
MQEDAEGHEEMERALRENPVMLAAKGGHVEAVRTLLDHPAADVAGMLSSTGTSRFTALMLAAMGGHVEAMRTLLDHTSADAAAMMGNPPGTGGWTALKKAATGGHVEAMRTLLDHPSADAAAMLLFAGNGAVTALMFAAKYGHMAAIRLLLDHPSADVAAMLSAIDIYELTAFMLSVMMRYARCGGYYCDDPERSFAPLLLLLRRVAVDPPQLSGDQVAHMSRVIVELCLVPEEDEGQEEGRAGLFDDDQPDDARDECVRLLLELGAQCGVIADTPVVSRIIREVFTMARVPQLLNEAVLGVAIARQ